MVRRSAALSMACRRGCGSRRKTFSTGWTVANRASSRFTTQRREPDTVEILSGTFEGETTGTPISLLIRNQDQRSKDYSKIKDLYRPGHADITYDAKYGVRDYRGGGRSSARETACRVAAGAVARQILGERIEIRGYMVQMGDDGIDRARFDEAVIESNPFWVPDADAALRWEDKLDAARKSGSSLGAMRRDPGARGAGRAG